MKANVFRGINRFGVDEVERPRAGAAPLLTHSFSLKDIGDAYALFGERREGAIKAAIRP